MNWDRVQKGSFALLVVGCLSTTVTTLKCPASKSGTIRTLNISLSSRWLTYFTGSDMSSPIADQIHYLLGEYLRGERSLKQFDESFLEIAWDVTGTLSSEASTLRGEVLFSLLNTPRGIGVKPSLSNNLEGSHNPWRCVRSNHRSPRDARQRIALKMPGKIGLILKK